MSLFQKYQIEHLPIEMPPFGLDERGQKIRDVTGRSIKSSVEQMMEVVRRETAQSWPADMGAEERERRTASAAQAALDQLVAMLNDSFRDRRFRVAADYLLNANNYYSYEFSLVVHEYARAICGDEQFGFERGTRVIPQALVWITRPLSIAQTYEAVPRLVARFGNIDVRVQVSGDRATIQWWPIREMERLPERHRRAYLRMGCEVYRGVFAAIPQLKSGLPLATARDLRCTLEGDECCEWEFTWQAVAASRIPRSWLGLLMSVTLLALSLTSLLVGPAGPSTGAVVRTWFLALLAPLPLLVSWYGSRLRQARAAEARYREQLLEQQQQSDEQHSELLAAYRNHQLANVGLERKVAELTVLHEIGLTVASTLDLDELLERALRIVTEELYFDRALIMLSDEERGVLTGGHVSGGTPEVAALVEQLEIPLDKKNWATVRAVLSGEPVLTSSIEEVAPDALDIVEALQTHSFLAVPLRTKGRSVGVLMVDNATSALPITAEDQSILRTLGGAMATAIENARLYQAIEEYNRTLGQRVEERTQQLCAANDDLLREKEKLDAVLRNIADGLVVTDRQERVILTNPVFDAIVDQPGSALLGQPIGDLMHDPLLVTLVHRALEHPREVQDARVVLETRIYKASACALRGNGLPSGVVTILRDVTHEVEVDRMKTEFIASVSHELRTPLTSILGFAKLIRRSFDRVVVPVLSGKRHTQGAAQRIGENLNIIVSEGERLTRLINDVLDIAKMETGKVEWYDQPLDLPALIQRAVDGVQGLTEEKGLSMRVQTAGPLPTPVADPDRMLQVLTNLLSNSIKFTERGEVRVSVRPLAAGDEIHGWQVPRESAGGVLISVADTGVGIPAAELPRLFQRFRQVTGDTLTDKPQGTGLGLAICREIVSHYGGAIWAESTPGLGSIFSFTLPLTPAKVPSFETALPARPLVPEVRPPEDRERLILVVDDEENIRNLLRQELTEAGYQVIEAADGAEALHRARQEKPALITLDLLLPDISGFDVTSALKADQATADIPILILSIVEDQEKGLRLGADAYLTKPLDTAQLLRSIATLLTRTERRGG